jgi:hypothetical protein
MKIARHEVVRHEITPETIGAAFSQIVVGPDGARVVMQSGPEKPWPVRIERSEHARELGEALLKAAEFMVEQEKAAALNGRKALEEVKNLTA